VLVWLPLAKGEEPPMTFSESLAERIRQALARRKSVEEKKMFGGIGFPLNSNMVVGVWKESLIVRLGPDAYEDALLESHVKKFDLTGRAMKGWVMVEPKGIEEGDQLSGWILRAVKFVGKLPKK
jgi:TfoX/Sxy family transcriptional regulator of competence genes